MAAGGSKWPLKPSLEPESDTSHTAAPDSPRFRHRLHRVTPARRATGGRPGRLDRAGAPSRLV